MVKHWIFYDNNTDPLIILDSYSWDESGLNIVIKTFLVKSEIERKYNIHFGIEVEAYHVLFLPNSLAANDWIYKLMCEAKEESPCVPLFIQDESPMINEVKKTADYDALGKEYLHYVIYTVDMWIDVVSSNPPTVVVKDNNK